MKRKTRMYEPYGYMDEHNYESSEIIQENEYDSFFSDVNYKKDDNKIHFLNKDAKEVASLDVNEFVKSDSIIDHIEYNDGILKIYFTNGDIITIDLTELLDENEFKDGLVINDHVVKVLIDDNSDKYISVSENGVKIAGVEADIEAEKTRAEGEEQRIENKLGNEITRAISAETDLQNSIELKADKETVYTQEQVDALIKTKETEIYNLTKLVGEIGGNVTYDYPNDLGTSLTSLLNNSGTVKLGEDATITRFGPGITAKNKVKLNLNSHNLTATAAGGYGAIMSRGTQEITIGGKGTVDAGDGICIEANGTGCTINLTGSTTVYQNDRSGGELIYCYAGTINITNGTFKNNGEDKKYLLNCYDANYAAGTAKIIVSGGKFYDFNPADNSAEGEHTNFLAPGYHVETSTDGDSTVYTVKKDA